MMMILMILSLDYPMTLIGICHRKIDVITKQYILQIPIDMARSHVSHLISEKSYGQMLTAIDIS